MAFASIPSAPGGVATTIRRDVITPEFNEAWHRTFSIDRLDEPADIAKAVTFLASDYADWITGITLLVDGGSHLRGIPDYADYLLRESGARSAPITDWPNQGVPLHIGQASASMAAAKLPTRRRIVRSEGVIRAAIHESFGWNAAMPLDELSNSIESSHVLVVNGVDDLVWLSQRIRPRSSYAVTLGPLARISSSQDHPPALWNAGEQACRAAKVEFRWRK